MDELLKDISRRPEPFCCYTAMTLWTRPHLAQQMQKVHLSQETDLASHRLERIYQIVSWIDSQLHLSGKRICDLGCGPGLYTQRFSAAGAIVTGVDFSTNSLDYAKRKAMQEDQSIRYLKTDYLSDDLPAGFDIVTLIFTDFCVLSLAQRTTVLRRIREILNPDGYLVMDVSGMGSFVLKEQFTLIENNLMNGFWSERDYVGIHRAFVYPEGRLSLDRFIIVEPNETWQIFNWFQYFTAESLQTELAAAGFVVEQMVAGLTGKTLQGESDLIGVIASVP